VFITLYVNFTVIVLKPSCLDISKLPTTIFGKKSFKLDEILSFKNSKLSVVI